MPHLLRALIVVLALAQLHAAEPGRLSFTMTTTVAGNTTVTVEVAYPVDEAGKPTAEAKDIAYYAPYWCEDHFATDHGVFEAMARHFTVVGIFFDDRKLPAEAKDSIDPESGSLDVVMAAVEEARKRLGLPPGKVFACGHSSGGTQIYYAARAMPELFEAIAPIAGRAPEVTVAPAVPTLHVMTFGDNRAKQALAWHQLQAPAGWSTMLTTDPRWESRDNQIWLHLNSSESIALTVDWLRAVADLRAAHGGVLPPPRSWPAQIDAARIAATAETQMNGLRALPSVAIAERIRAAHRRVETSEDAATGLRMVRVTPLTGVDRTVVVLVDPSRKPDAALYDAVLAAGKGADAIAIRSSNAQTAPAAIARLIAAEQERDPGRPCLVIAEATTCAALDALPPGVLRVAIDPRATVAPGTTTVVVAEAGSPAGSVTVTGPFSSPEIRRQRLLAAACAVAIPH
jgi:pimeloyl-ACP methyl ester carboxylesterase